MEKIEVKLKRIHPDAKIPLYGSEEAAGFDLYSIETTTINPGEIKKIPTGLSLEIPKGYHMQVWDRSGKAKESVHHIAGIIDSDYRGELNVMLFNLGKEPHTIEKGERMVQALILPILRAEFKETDELNSSKRGQGGFGSTGTK